MMRRSIVLLLLLGPASVAAQDTVRFTPKVQQPTFAVREPVLRVRSGTVLVSKTHYGPYYSEAGGAFPGEVGPIYIEGATTKDMLKVEIVKVRPNSPYAASQVYSDFGGLATDTRARVLRKGAPIPGLYAAGEITGHFYGTAPNAVSVLRAFVFGRVAGREAVGNLSTDRN